MHKHFKDKYNPWILASQKCKGIPLKLLVTPSFLQIGMDVAQAKPKSPTKSKRERTNNEPVDAGYIGADAQRPVSARTPTRVHGLA